MAQIAIAWVLSKPGVTAPIVGTTSLSNLEDILGKCLSRVFLGECRRAQRWCRWFGRSAVRGRDQVSGRAVPACGRFWSCLSHSYSSGLPTLRMEYHGLSPSRA